MQADTFHQFDPKQVPSPCFVIDEVAIERNLKILAKVQAESGAKILLALKAFSMFSLAPLIQKYLHGCACSGLYEARLAYEEFGGQLNAHEKREVHTFCAAYKDSELNEIIHYSDHLIFNTWEQWQRFKPELLAAQKNKPGLRFGLRVNPLHSEGTTPIYDPCAPGSRLGIPYTDLLDKDLSGISGLHFHTLCEQAYEPLDRTLSALEEAFGEKLQQFEWLNLGGGHHISHPDYDTNALIKRLKALQKHYGLQAYLEPGEAIAIRSGVLVSEVLAFGHNEIDVAILDTSATCHMPDTLEMPYRPEIALAGGVMAAEEGQYKHNYRLGGQSCLAGDVMGSYSFKQALELGQRLMFDDMAHYTMVKTNTFNGIALPAIAIWNSETQAIKMVKQFDYHDFKQRLS